MQAKGLEVITSAITVSMTPMVSLTPHSAVMYRVCNRLSGYSSYLDIRKNLSFEYQSGIFLFEKNGLRFSIRRYLGIRHWNRQFAYYSNIILKYNIRISG